MARPSELDGVLVAQVLDHHADRLAHDPQTSIRQRRDDAVVRKVIGAQIDVTGQQHRAKLAGRPRLEARVVSSGALEQ